MPAILASVRHGVRISIPTYPSVHLTLPGACQHTTAKPRQRLPRFLQSRLAAPSRRSQRNEEDQAIQPIRPIDLLALLHGPEVLLHHRDRDLAIGTCQSVERKYQKMGVAYRFAFLTKSHVRQNKVAAGQALYKCLFCVFLSVHAPIIQGTEAYIDHVAQKHRASNFSQVMLYRTGCVNDRICAAEESFDINLYPVAAVYVASAGSLRRNSGMRVQ
ncbi:hypothetical protein LTR91_013204 [Friedmanniomyces endolithicus]|uniref:Uncharacterized protein n=1 Tax=Friedmanniomyces endolithicus TaxID=329885 RepID=A0AAN6KDY7_9PEZI|nr:hypothetical protein LTR91_013204 [Friedmanniomyces endolithicus]KAK1001943.1 hypothetical protein LTS01_004463 [Friedmanniomyces endolithicus]KAK1042759.1 hypothetical protein LTS16_008504 [Friedmanniomyces endolithicus]